jgi:hypothetical protein
MKTKMKAGKIGKSPYGRLQKAYRRMTRADGKLTALQRSVRKSEDALNAYQDKYERIIGRGHHYAKSYGNALKKYKKWQIRNAMGQIEKMVTTRRNVPLTAAQKLRLSKLTSVIDSANKVLETYDWEH